MDFEPAQGGGVTGQGSASLAGVTGTLAAAKLSKAAWMRASANACDARTETQESLRVAFGGSGVFLVG